LAGIPVCIPDVWFIELVPGKQSLESFLKTFDVWAHLRITIFPHPFHGSALPAFREAFGKII
jgi:hypothetical protein